MCTKNILMYVTFSLVLCHILHFTNLYVVQLISKDYYFDISVGYRLFTMSSGICRAAVSILLFTILSFRQYVDYAAPLLLLLLLF